MEMFIGIIAMILWDAIKDPLIKWARNKAKTWWESRKNPPPVKSTSECYSS